MTPVSRRALLKGMVGAAGLAALGPIAGARAGGARQPLLRAGSLPYPNLPEGVDTLPQIDHIVVLMMENHSYDCYFGMLGMTTGRGDGYTPGPAGRPANTVSGPDGAPVGLHHAPSTCQANYRVSQSWDCSHQSWDGGRNDGFVVAPGNSADAMAFWTAADLPFYDSLARTFVLCDRYFASVMAQTYPNRRFLIAGSAFGQVSDPFPSPTDPDPRPNGFGTIFDMLNAFGISWKDYFADLPTAGLFPYVVEQNPGKVVPVADFFADCAAGTLPFFSLVDPESFEGSEENPQDAQAGAYYAYRVVDAVLNSPAWGSTVLILTFDEHGGYYDHVPPVRAVRPDGIAPAVAAGDTYGDLYSWTGFRVPTVVVSPWARADHVSHTVYDHTSILRLIETKWNLPALSARDANANNMLDCLDFRRPTFPKPPQLTAAPPPTGLPACVAADPTGQ